MQQRVPTENAKRGDEYVDRLADRDTSSPQRAVITDAAQRDIFAQHVFIGKRRHQPAGPAEVCRSIETAQHLTPDQVAGKQIFVAEQRLKQVGFGRRRTVEVIDPYRAVDEQHSPQDSTFAALGEIAAPPKLAAKAANLLLFLQAHEELQAPVNDRSLGLQSGELYGAAHEPLIEMNVGSHSTLCTNLGNHAPRASLAHAAARLAAYWMR